VDESFEVKPQKIENLHKPTEDEQIQSSKSIIWDLDSPRRIPKAQAKRP